MAEMSYLETHSTPHGPGPPNHSVPESMVQSQQQALIHQLQHELEICVGKIKGYETLGHLLQESKQECARYKQTNDELAKRLDSLTRRSIMLEPAEEMVGVACAPPTLTPAVNAESFGSCVNVANSKVSSLTSPISQDAIANSENVLQKSEAPKHSLSLPDSFLVQSDSGRGVNLVNRTARSPPQRSPESSFDALSASSVSFIQISNSEAGSPPTTTPLLCNSIGDVTAQQPEKSAVSFDANAERLTSMDLSSEISNITEHLKTIGQKSGVSAEDLATDLIKAGISVIKLQKQSRVQQVMLGQMSSQITELKAENDAKQQTINVLQKDCDSLRNSIKRVELARDQARQDAQVKYGEMAKEKDDLIGGPSSVEWVEVKTQQKCDNTTTSMTEAGTNSNQTIVTAIPMVEVELRRRVEKLNATISELVSVNHSWDEHCRQIEASHQQQIAAMQSKQNEMILRLEEFERSDQQRQVDFDNMLLGAKKQREAEESAKEDALKQLHMEHQLRIDLEQKCIEFSRKTAELEQRLLLLQNSRQLELTHNLQAAQLLTNPSSDKEKELMTQLLILQEQVSVFKEDFDQERRDRELTRAKMEKLRKKLEETTNQLTTTHSQLMQTTMELNATRTESERWRQRFTKLSNDVQSIQRQARPLNPLVTPETALTPSAVRIKTPPVLASQLQPAPRNTVVRFPDWTCACCTFNNPGQRLTCEMCGKTNSDAFLQPEYTHLTGGRSVAGLQEMQSAMPTIGLKSRRLETDFIDSLPDSRQ